MSVKRFLISIIAVLALSGLGYWGYLQFLAPVAKSNGQTAAAPEESITGQNQAVVTAEGQIVPLSEASLAAEAGGIVNQILISPGDSVTRGTPLVQLDRTEEEIGLSQAQAVLAGAEANLQEALAGVMGAETAVLAAEIEVAAAEARYALLAASPKPELMALNQALVNAAQAEVARALGNQNLLLEGSTMAQIQAAEAAVGVAQAEFATVVRLYEPVAQDDTAPAEEREQARLQLNAATANLAAAQANLAEVRRGPSEAQRLAASGAVEAAQSQAQSAEADQALLLAGPQAERLAVAQAEIDLAQERLGEIKLQVTQAETAVLQAEAAVTEAKTQVEAAQLALEKRTLLAPINGTVAEILAEEGELVTAGQPVVLVADFSQWRLETTDLVEADVVVLSRGQAASVVVDAFVGQSLTAEVVDIAALSSEVRGDVTYVVTLSLPASGQQPLRWGMSAFVTIEKVP